MNGGVRARWQADWARKDVPTTMTVNWTPFLTLFPLRRPANDMMDRGWREMRDDLGDDDRFFEEEHEGRLGRWRLQTPPCSGRLPLH